MAGGSEAAHHRVGGAVRRAVPAHRPGAPPRLARLQRVVLHGGAVRGRARDEARRRRLVRGRGPVRDARELQRERHGLGHRDGGPAQLPREGPRRGRGGRGRGGVPRGHARGRGHQRREPVPDLRVRRHDDPDRPGPVQEQRHARRGDGPRHGQRGREEGLRLHALGYVREARGRGRAEDCEDGEDAVLIG